MKKKTKKFYNAVFCSYKDYQELKTYLSTKKFGLGEKPKRWYKVEVIADKYVVDDTGYLFLFGRYRTTFKVSKLIGSQKTSI